MPQLPNQWTARGERHLPYQKAGVRVSHPKDSQSSCNKLTSEKYRHVQSISLILYLVYYMVNENLKIS